MRYERRRVLSREGCDLELLVDPQVSQHDLDACLALVNTAGWETGCGVLLGSGPGAPLLVLARTAPQGATLPWMRVQAHGAVGADPHVGRLQLRVRIALDPAGRAKVTATLPWADLPRQQPLAALVPPGTPVTVLPGGTTGKLDEMRVGHLLLLFPPPGGGAAEVRFERRLDLSRGGVLLHAKEGWIPRVLAPEVVDSAAVVVEAAGVEVIANAPVEADGALGARGLDSFVMAVRRPGFAGLHIAAEKGHVVVHSGRDRVRGIDLEREIGGMLRHFQELFAELDRLHIIECPTVEALALSFPGLIAMDPRLFDSPATALFRFLPHELAHQWIGNRVTFDGPGHLWLSEGLPEFLQLHWVRERLGERLYRRGLIYSANVWARRARQRDMAILDWTPHASGHLFDALAAKGTVAWHHFAAELGETAFRCLLKGLLELPNPVRVSEALALAEQISGRDLGPFRQDWLARPGWPARAAIAPDRGVQDPHPEEETDHGTSGPGGRGSL